MIFPSFKKHLQKRMAQMANYNSNPGHLQWPPTRKNCDDEEKTGNLLRYLAGDPGSTD